MIYNLISKIIKIGMIYIVFFMFMSCSSNLKKDFNNFICFSSNYKFFLPLHTDIRQYDNYVHHVANIYKVDEKLVKAIIQVESAYNPKVVSKSNAIGLMQLKADTAGKDAYRMKGLKGKPNSKDLKNAFTNIDLGVAYLSILQKSLLDIHNTRIKRYALTVAYVNGLETLLRVFSTNSVTAIKKINQLTPAQFCQYIQDKHPSPQASRYLYKINVAYAALN